MEIVIVINAFEEVLPLFKNNVAHLGICWATRRFSTDVSPLFDANGYYGHLIDRNGFIKCDYRVGTLEANKFRANFLRTEIKNLQKLLDKGQTTI